MDLNLFPNEILENIFQFLDVHGKLQVMSTGTRFESVIAQSSSLCRDFMLLVDDEKLQDPGYREALRSIRRHFGKVQNDHLNTILELLEKIGPGITSLTLKDMELPAEAFLMMIKPTNPKTLKICHVQFTGDIAIGLNLTNLRTLIIEEVQHPAILRGIVPSSLEVLEIGDAWNDWNQLNEVLTNQTNLQKLKLNHVHLSAFHYSPMNSSITSLDLELFFFRPALNETIIAFLKSLTNLRKARLFGWGESQKGMQNWRTESLASYQGVFRNSVTFRFFHFIKN
jgi:hypothetical protein